MLPRFRSPEDVFEGSKAARRALEAVIGQRQKFYEGVKTWLRTDDPDPKQPDLDTAFFDELISRWDDVLKNLQRCDKLEAADKRSGRRQASASDELGDLEGIVKVIPMTRKTAGDSSLS